MSADDDLIARAKTGDADAWRELYVAHAGRLVVWLRTLPTGDTAAEPEDLASEAWLTAADKIAGFVGTGPEFAGWLFGIARNLALNARRKTVRRAADPHVTAAVGDAATAMVPEFGSMVWIRSVLATLPDREREVVACIDVVGLDVASTAAALGMKPTAVRVARHRALVKLRRRTDW